MDKYTLLYFKRIANKDLLYSTWNSAPCYVVAWMGGEFGENGTCICMDESLCCSPETVTTLLIRLHPNTKKKTQKHFKVFPSLLLPCSLSISCPFLLGYTFLSEKTTMLDTEPLAPPNRPSSYSISSGHPLLERWHSIFLKEGFDWVVRVWGFLRTPELQSLRWQFRTLRFQSGRVGCRHLSSPSQSSAEQLHFYMHCTFGVLHNILSEESIP